MSPSTWDLKSDHLDFIFNAEGYFADFSGFLNGIDLLSAILTVLGLRILSILSSNGSLVGYLLQETQDELEKINEKASHEVLAVEQKYNEIRRLVLSYKNEIIKAIPDFWLSAFLSRLALLEFLTDEYPKIFKYFSFLEVEDLKDVKSGYSITFNFNPSP
ncbi:NAP1- protein 2 [Dionaea muscipula]